MKDFNQIKKEFAHALGNAILWSIVLVIAIGFLVHVLTN